MSANMYDIKKTNYITEVCPGTLKIHGFKTITHSFFIFRATYQPLVLLSTIYPGNEKHHLNIWVPLDRIVKDDELYRFLKFHHLLDKNFQKANWENTYYTTVQE